MSGIKGWPSQQKISGGTQPLMNDFVTVQPTDENRRAFDTTTRFAFRVGSDTVPRTAQGGTGNPTGSGGTVVFDTATQAKVGDFVRFEDGNAAFIETAIVAVETNSFVLGARLYNPPQSGDEFFILRYATQRVAEDGSQLVQLSPTPPPDPVGFDSIAVSASPITTGAYTELTASLADSVTEIEVNNSTGKTLILAIGPASSEVDTILIFTPGLSRQALAIPAASRVSLKALRANATVGEVNINYFG